MVWDFNNYGGLRLGWDIWTAEEHIAKKRCSFTGSSRRTSVLLGLGLGLEVGAVCGAKIVETALPSAPNHSPKAVPILDRV